MKKSFKPILILTLICTFCFTAKAQNYGKLISQDVYHYYWAFTLYGNTSYHPKNYKIEIYEKALVQTFVTENGNLSTDSRDRKVFDYVNRNSDGSVSYKLESEILTVHKNGKITSNKFSSPYEKGFVSESGATLNYNSVGTSNTNTNSASGSRTCSLCNGSGRCCGAGNVAYQNLYCGGNGRCHPCNGSGWRTNSITGDRMQCTYCRGTGRCSQCNGTGACEKCGGSGRH